MKLSSNRSFRYQCSLFRRKTNTEYLTQIFPADIFLSWFAHISFLGPIENRAAGVPSRYVPYFACAKSPGIFGFIKRSAGPGWRDRVGMGGNCRKAGKRVGARCDWILTDPMLFIAICFHQKGQQRTINNEHQNVRNIL